MAAFLSAQAVHYGDEPMLRVDGTGRAYEALRAAAYGLARGLSSMGVGPGSRVALLMDTSHQAIDAWFASALLGCVEAPLNCNYRGSLLTHLIEDSAAEFVICDRRYLPELDRALAGGSRRPTVIVNAAAADPPGGGAVTF